MKIAPLLAQYLYTNGKLDLPGIGTFFLENHSSLPTIDSKNKTSLLEGVSFNHDKNTAEDPELIAYISAQAGKIKPLASADLESHLELAKQFLNIGKPFLFEGIGTLSKRGNEFDFSPGTMIAEPVKEQNIREALQQQASDDTGSYSDVFYAKKNAAKNAWKKPAIFFLVIAGLGLAVWGGYTVYKKTSGNNTKEEASSTSTEVDTTKNNVSSGSIPSNDTNQTKITNTPTLSVIIPAGSYKFILEKSDSIRANARYARLKKFGWNVNIEKVDSTSFRLFLNLPATVADTARLVDSLSRLNGRRVIIQ